jgi:uncharacterized protein
MAASLWTLDKPRQVVIAGEPADPRTKALIAERNRHFLPNAITILVSDKTRDRLAERLPFVRDMRPIDGGAAAYVCENYTCRLPVNDVSALAGLLT